MGSLRKLDALIASVAVAEPTGIVTACVRLEADRYGRSCSISTLTTSSSVVDPVRVSVNDAVSTPAMMLDSTAAMVTTGSPGALRTSSVTSGVANAAFLPLTFITLEALLSFHSVVP